MFINHLWCSWLDNSRLNPQIAGSNTFADTLKLFWVRHWQQWQWKCLQTVCVDIDGVPSLSILLSCLDSNSLAAVFSEDVKDRAKGVADGWSQLLESLDMDGGNGNSLEAHAFLQLLATFGIVSDFKEDELLKLIPRLTLSSGSWALPFSWIVRKKCLVCSLI